MKCPKCMEAIPEDSVFCPFCGTDVTAVITANPYCKSCGNAVPEDSEFCPFCGCKISSVSLTQEDDSPKNTSQENNKKRRPKRKVLYVFLILLLLFAGYVGVNYFCAVSAMDNQEFTKAKQHFDALFVSDAIFPQKYDYVEAGILMEKGKYMEALSAFNKLDNFPVPSAVITSLKAKIYSAGQAYYKAGSLTDATKAFTAIKDYKRSADYLTLIRCKKNFSSAYEPNRTYYMSIVNLLGFEDADEIIMNYESSAIKFLTGKWEGKVYYFKIDEKEHRSSYNLPNKDVDGYYSISEGVYSVGSTKFFKFSIIDEDTISVYCYKDGSTHTLYRQ